MEVIGRPIKKMVLDPETLDMKEEWLQALDLCQQSEMPEEIQGRIKESAEADDGDDEPEEGEEEVVEVAEEPVVKPKAVRPPTSGKAFDDYGRRRGDPAFGKPLGWEPDNGSEDSEGESDDEESASDDDEVIFRSRVPVWVILDGAGCVCRIPSQEDRHERCWKPGLTMSSSSRTRSQRNLAMLGTRSTSTSCTSAGLLYTVRPSIRLTPRAGSSASASFR